MTIRCRLNYRARFHGGPHKKEGGRVQTNVESHLRWPVEVRGAAIEDAAASFSSTIDERLVVDREFIKLDLGRQFLKGARQSISAAKGGARGFRGSVNVASV